MDKTKVFNCDCLEAMKQYENGFFDIAIVDPPYGDGSGSSRIAAYNLNREFVGYEIDKEYFEKQDERFRKHTAQLRIF